MLTIHWRCVYTFVLLLSGASRLEAATIYVPAGGDLQTALNNALPGDTLLLAENAEFVGNFVLPYKTGDQWITVRTAGTRQRAAGRAEFACSRRTRRCWRGFGRPTLRRRCAPPPARITGSCAISISPPTRAARATSFSSATDRSAQNTLAQVPHHFVLSHLYVHGDPLRRPEARHRAERGRRDHPRLAHRASAKASGRTPRRSAAGTAPDPTSSRTTTSKPPARTCCSAAPTRRSPNLVADGITFRRNYLSRPMAWRNPIVADAAGRVGRGGPGGSLPAGIYGYRVIARRRSGKARSAARRPPPK